MVDSKQFKSILDSAEVPFQGTVEINAYLHRFAYYRIGGPADVLVSPKTLDDLKTLHRALQETGAPHFILGWGSNLLISDDGFRGVVIRMKQLFTEIEEQSAGVLRVGASVGGSTLLRRAQSLGYGGLSHLTGIPGSVGGMTVMNAGTHLGEFKDCALEIESVNLSSRTFEIKTHRVTEGSFSYRHHHFLKAGDLVTHALLKYTPDDPKKIEAEINQLYTRRKETQPVDYPSCGSVFMNPPDGAGQGLVHAWQVIQKLGLRGHRIGDAQFSEKHCNFIINLDQAKASDVAALIQLAKVRAKDELGVTLKEEVRYVGSPARGSEDG